MLLRLCAFFRAFLSDVTYATSNRFFTSEYLVIMLEVSEKRRLLAHPLLRNCIL
jgi:hypothetical protein